MDRDDMEWLTANLTIIFLLALPITYTASQKMPPFYILNNSAKTKPILITFGGQNPEEISHHKIINSPISSE